MNRSRADRTDPLDDLPPGYPRALVEHMLTGWAPRSRPMIRRHPRVADFARRRAALSARFPGETLVLPGGAAPIRSNDTHYPFRPGSDLLYLSGCDDPEAALVIGADGEAVLYLEPAITRDNHRFFTDRHRGELWVGAGLGMEATSQRLGIRCESLDALHGRLTRPARLIRGVDPRVDEAMGAASPEDAVLGQAVAELRLIKDPGEIDAIKAAIRSTIRGFEDVVRELPRSRGERDVEVTFLSRARREGHGAGYGVIAAAGPHATVLHWSRNDGPLPANGLLLLDAGVEGREYYTADLTRTLPISGRFSPLQAQVYALVEAAWRAAVAEVRPGAAFTAPYRASSRVIVAGLHRLGVTLDQAAALDHERQLHRRYTLHAISHMLGLDVHDCARASAGAYKDGTLSPGMVLTIEPGLYFQPDDRTVPRALRGIGVRIEDDVLVTAEGATVLSRALPRSRYAVERWMAKIQAEKA